MQTQLNASVVRKIILPYEIWLRVSSQLRRSGYDPYNSADTARIKIVYVA